VGKNLFNHCIMLTAHTLSPKLILIDLMCLL